MNELRDRATDALEQLLYDLDRGAIHRREQFAEFIDLVINAACHEMEQRRLEALEEEASLAERAEDSAPDTMPPPPGLDGGE